MDGSAICKRLQRGGVSKCNQCQQGGWVKKGRKSVDIVCELPLNQLPNPFMWTLNEGDALGMTGQFVNEAAIICGGKNSIDNLNTCHEYNHIENE